jgi:predicted amidohydrolase
MTQIKIAAIQMTSGPDVEANLAAAASALEEASVLGAGCAVLPENFAVFDSKALWSQGVRERDEHVFSSQLQTWARQRNLWIVGGSIPHAEALPSARVRSRCHVVSPLRCEASYDKLHLFDVDVGDAQGRYHESETIAPGQDVVVVPTPFGRLGLSICYDLRFPSLFAQLRGLGAEIITVPAAFTRLTGAAHWLTLLRARAIETQCFVVAPNQTGRHSPSRETFGHSCIVSPWGEIIAMREEGPGVVCASLDMEQLADIRRKMPVFSHQRHAVTGPRPLE